MAKTSQIKCAKCRVALQGSSANPQPQDVFSCPRCGVSDTYKNIMREIEQYAADKMGERISSAFKKAARQSDFLTFRESHRPKKRRRFIVDLGI